jgi:hypothetical protein
VAFIPYSAGRKIAAPRKSRMLMPKMLHTGQVIIDLVMAVDKLPQIGGDVLAQSAGSKPAAAST